MVNKWWMPAIIVAVAIMISIQSWSNKLAVNPATDPNQGVSTSAQVTTNRDANVETITDHLKSTVRKLSDEIGARNLQHLTALNSAADFIDSKLNYSGYRTERQTFQVDGQPCHNVIAELAGKSVPQKILIVGAHYDSCQTTPGANDNATGVAAMLEIADQLSQFHPDCSIRFVAWTNEEPPYFQRENQMGSLVHAASCQQKGEEIIGVIALETMGY